jgi:hypothetical protein
MANYFDTKNAREIARAALLANPTKHTDPKWGGGSISKANLWITATADMEGVRLDDPRVALARRWLGMFSNCTA